MARSCRSRFATLALLLALGACQDRPPVGAPGDDPVDEVLERITRHQGDGSLHLVRLVQRGDLNTFSPAELSVTSGDVVRFVLAGAQPESIAFDPDQATLEAAAYIREEGLQYGVLMTESGQTYDVELRGAPAGRYPFHSVSHAIDGMRGVLNVNVSD